MGLGLNAASMVGQLRPGLLNPLTMQKMEVMLEGQGGMGPKLSEMMQDHQLAAAENHRKMVAALLYKQMGQSPMMPTNEAILNEFIKNNLVAKTQGYFTNRAEEAMRPELHSLLQTTKPVFFYDQFSTQRQDRIKVKRSLLTKRVSETNIDYDMTNFEDYKDPTVQRPSYKRRVVALKQSRVLFKMAKRFFVDELKTINRYAPESAPSDKSAVLKKIGSPKPRVRNELPPPASRPPAQGDNAQGKPQPQITANALGFMPPAQTLINQGLLQMQAHNTQSAIIPASITAPSTVSNGQIIPNNSNNGINNGQSNQGTSAGNGNTPISSATNGNASTNGTQASGKLNAENAAAAAAAEAEKIRRGKLLDDPICIDDQRGYVDKNNQLIFMQIREQQAAIHYIYLSLIHI
eukprot:TRINITY_DN14038_c0_g1_i1.p1 TRINITY_DN14038_c0_g1~~TRINITY_DN14038_c0_g1_i1.p1  ORF type:complete len:406 (-),score=59.84 TRINITY_DN14038_c0_g1_i1:59-1276(-)